MDSLTQAVLGAAVGEAVGGKTLGRRAALWGAVAGTLPDLDILAYPLLDPVGELRFHRGITHALVFAPLVAPLLGRALAGWDRWRGHVPAGSWRLWTAVFFWSLLTHPLLDWFTVYGTQLLQPFSDHPAALASVSIIDPLYTLPLATALVVALVWRQRRAVVWVGLAASTAYLGWGLAAQQVARAAVDRSLAASGVTPSRVLVTPTFGNTLLWHVVAEDGDRFLVGSRSLFDGDRPVRFREVPKRAGALAPFEGTRAMEALRWFSRGFLPVVAEAGGAPVVADLRFGRIDAVEPAPPPAAYVFAWRIAQGPDGEVMFENHRPELSLTGDRLGGLLGRMLGREPPAAPRVPSGPSDPDPP